MPKAIWFTLGFFCALLVALALVAGPLSTTIASPATAPMLPIQTVMPTLAPTIKTLPTTVPTPLPEIGLSWQRTGGYTGLCQSLDISDQRTAHFAPCDEGKQLALLTTSERKQFDQYVQSYAPFTYQAQQEITSQGQFSLSIQFSGHGKAIPTEVEQERMVQWAGALYERLEAEKELANLIARARLDLAVRENLIVDDIDTVSIEPQTWPDACLGLGEAGLFCVQVITPGYRITLRMNGQLYIYRTDLATQIRYQGEPA